MSGIPQQDPYHFPFLMHALSLEFNKIESSVYYKCMK